MSKNNQKEEKSKWRIVSNIIDILLYVSIIFILIFWQIFPSLFPNLSIETILISILVLFGASWIHTIENIGEVKSLFQQLDATDVMQYDFLNNLLDRIAKQKHTIRELKIVDNSAEDFLHFFVDPTVQVTNCTLLLRDYYTDSSNYDAAKVDQLEKSIEKWKKLKNQGRIKNLNVIKYYDNITTFFCIIDEEMILSGFLKNEAIRDDPNVMFIDITSRKGYNLIQQYIKEFDYLLNKTASAKNIASGLGNVCAYTNVNAQESKERLKRELLTTKFVSAVGLACTEITNLSYEDLNNVLITNGGCIKVMFMDPDKEEINIREKIEHGDDITEFQFPSIVKYNRSRLLKNVETIKANNNLDSNWKHLFLGKYNFQPTINCILTDNYVFVHHYGMKHCGMDVPNFIISKESDEAIYNYYKGYVEEFWNRGETYD